MVNTIFSKTDDLKKSTKELILKSKKSWQENYNRFNPDSSLLKTLKEKLMLIKNSPPQIPERQIQIIEQI